MNGCRIVVGIDRIVVVAAAAVIAVVVVDVVLFPNTKRSNHILLA